MGRKKRRGRKKRSSERKLTVALDWIEIALGDDGWGRGDPEPVLLVGLYALTEAGVSLVSRGLARPRVRSPYPNDTDGPERPIIETRPPRSPQGSLALLVLALEEDGGQDVRELYAMLEEPGFTLWCDEDPEPNPRGLAEWMAGPSGTFGAHPLHGEVDLAERCRSDEWVGATLIVGVARGARHRVHVRSPDGDNDWTVELALR